MLCGFRLGTCIPGVSAVSTLDQSTGVCFLDAALWLPAAPQGWAKGIVHPKNENSVIIESPSC